MTNVGVTAIAHGQLLILIGHRKKLFPLVLLCGQLQDSAAESIYWNALPSHFVQRFCMRIMCLSLLVLCLVRKEWGSKERSYTVQNRELIFGHISLQIVLIYVCTHAVAVDGLILRLLNLTDV